MSSSTSHSSEPSTSLFSASETSTAAVVVEADPPAEPGKKNTIDINPWLASSSSNFQTMSTYSNEKSLNSSLNSFGDSSSSDISTRIQRTTHSSELSTSSRTAVDTSAVVVEPVTVD